mmetsp:Transcript_132609/g.369716  ORF Transcript_132609/g.369716 Transcript_132609/m.369716 type:complete len:211 (-) Transcript_132609:190-822(-)
MKSSFCSETSGAAVSDTPSILFSKFSTMSDASCRRRAATNRCSWSRRVLLSASRSACRFANCSSIFAISPNAAGSDELALASRWRWCRTLRVASMPATALAWAAPAFSQAAFILSGSFTSPPLTSDSVASLAASASFSTSTILAITSRRTVACFLSATPFRMSPSFLDVASKRVWSLFSSSPQPAAALSDKRLAARRFIAMKVLVPPTTV